MLNSVQGQSGAPPQGAPPSSGNAVAPTAFKNADGSQWTVDPNNTPAAASRRMSSSYENVANPGQYEADQKILAAAQDGKIYGTDGQLHINPELISQQATQEGQKAAATSGVAEVSKANENAAAAQQSILRLKQMKMEVAGLPAGGLLTMGPGAPERNLMANILNAGSRALTGKDAVDPSVPGALEALTKDNFKLATDQVKGMGREPGYILGRIAGANPGPENSPLGFKRVAAGMTAGLKWQNDYANYIPKYFQEHGNTLGAQTEFAKTHSMDEYAARGLASVMDPRDASLLSTQPDNPALIKKLSASYGKDVIDAVKKNRFDVGDGT